MHQSGRIPAPIVLSKRAATIRQTSFFETPLDGFSYFMPDSLLLFILENTNENVQNFHNGLADDADYFYKNKHCKLFDMVELKAFFGLLYLRALLKSNLFLADVICYHELSNDLFVATLNMKRFRFISHFIEFDVRKLGRTLET